MIDIEQYEKHYYENLINDITLLTSRLVNTFDTFPRYENIIDKKIVIDIALRVESLKSAIKNLENVNTKCRATKEEVELLHLKKTNFIKELNTL